MSKKTIGKVLIVIPPLVNQENDGTVQEKVDIEAFRLVSPIEPATVAADLSRRGFQVRLFDLGMVRSGKFRRLEEILLDYQPDAVALVQSILTFATATDWDGGQVFQLVRKVLPDAITVLSGSHACNFPGQAVSERVCDFSIRGEVDLAMGDLFCALNEGAELSRLSGFSGLSFLDAGGDVRISKDSPKVDLADLPVPAFEILDASEQEAYFRMPEYGKIRFPEKSLRYRDLMTSRGCVMRCAFCCVNHLRGQKYRRKPLDMVMREVDAALTAGIEEIHFFDDCFATDERQILDFCEALRQRNLKFHWFVAQGMPLWPITKDALAAMHEVGMYRIICPFESGSDRVLKEVMGKATTVQHNHEVIGWAHALGMEIIGMFVVGMPGEQRQELLQTIQFAEHHPQIDYSVFSIATPMVGTKLMDTLIEQGRFDDPTLLNRIIKRTVALYRTDEFSEYELGIIRVFDWDRINFSTPERRAKYARMVGLTGEQLEETRAHSAQVFQRFFPDYDGPRSFAELVNQPHLFDGLAPLLRDGAY
ncbi:MAG TPA: hypothetical protein DD435_00320 [Cyanobacteria bacterium UBA8530]|nr:hypothetical protein [Cyanobacteria bacterium UBA8530]